MKKILALALSAILLSSISPASGATQTCTKKELNKIKNGQICLIVNKKYVWKKYQAPVVAKPTPIATPTPTPTPTPVVIEKTKLEKDFDDITRLSEDSSVAPSFTINVVSSTDVKDSSVEHIKAKYQKDYNFWSHYVSGLKNLSLIISTGDNVRWLADQIDKIVGHPDNLFYQANVDSVTREPCQNFGAGSLFLITDIYINTYRLYPQQCSTQEPTKPEYVGAPFHEFTHNMQTALTGDARLLPCWIKEGQATFYENNLGNAGNFAEFTKVKNMWLSRVNKYNFSTTIKKLDTNYGDGNCSRDGGYEYGYTAMQLLANKYGQSKSIDFLKEVGVTKDWKVAFERTYGQTLDQWLADSAKDLSSV